MVQHKQLLLVAIWYSINAAGCYMVQHKQMLLVIKKLLQKPTQDISLLRIFQLNHIVLHSYQSVQCVCACVRACVCMRACACVCVCVCVRLLHNYA